METLDVKYPPSILTNFSHEINWRRYGSNFTLQPGDVHVWKINAAKQFTSLFKEHRSILSIKEILKAQQFFWEKDFKSYLTRRIFLRILLGKYLKVKASQIQFNLEAKKPEIISDRPLRYSLSYSGAHILISMALCETGIDIEKIKPNFDYKPILNDCFADEEIEVIENTAEDSRRNFFIQWTRKEALLKYTGQGIIDDLTDVPSSDGRHIIKNKSIKITENVHVSSFLLNQDCLVSLASPSYALNIKYLEW